MYDDLHTYVKPGTSAFAQRQNRDTYDKDPDTVSMYDDLHTYVKPGSSAFAQKMDNYDKDPNTVSEYDDPHKRSTPAWILNGGVKKAGKKSKKSKSKGKKKSSSKSKKSKSKGKKSRRQRRLRRPNSCKFSDKIPMTRTQTLFPCMMTSIPM